MWVKIAERTGLYGIKVEYSITNASEYWTTEINRFRVWST
jgi:hypothetical protein